MDPHIPIRLPDGTVLQSGITTYPKSARPTRANGLLLKGVITATYAVDDPQHPIAGFVQNNESAQANIPVAVYCDVLCYTNIANMRWRFIPRCLVSQDNGGVHNGRVWRPRAATLDMSTGSAIGTDNPVDLDQGTNPANLDGDHVLIGFVNDNLNEPIILRGIPHPNSDVGNENATTGNRLRLCLIDGDPELFKHKGGFYGIDADGNFQLNLERAYAGDLESDGKEPVPANNGIAGNFRMRLPEGSKFEIDIAGGETITLEMKDGDAKLTLGDGLKSAIIAETFETFWNSTFKPIFDAFAGHVHGAIAAPATPFTGAPLAAVPVPLLPAFPPASISNKVKFPDNL